MIEVSFFQHYCNLFHAHSLTHLAEVAALEAMRGGGAAGEVPRHERGQNRGPKKVEWSL